MAPKLLLMVLASASLCACSVGGTSSSSFLSSSSSIPSSSSSSSEPYRLPLNAPKLYLGDGLLFWEKISQAKDYSIYCGSDLIGTTSNTYFELPEAQENATFSLVANPLFADSFKESAPSNEVEFMRLNEDNSVVFDSSAETSSNIVIGPTIIDFSLLPTDSAMRYWNKTITITERTLPLTIRLSSAPSVYGSGQTPIVYTGRLADMPLLTIDATMNTSFHFGDSELPGADGHKAYSFFEEGGDGAKGGDGFYIAKVRNLLIKHGESLLVQGGNGAKGGDGGEADGNNGGDGGNGGDGATTFIATEKIFTYNTTDSGGITLRGGNGGEGGKKGFCNMADFLNSAVNGAKGKDGANYVGALVTIK